MAQTQRSIKQYEIGSLSPFGDFLHSILLPELILYQHLCRLQVLAFILTLVLHALFTAGSLSHISDSLTHFHSRNITVDAVISCHIIKALKTEILDYYF